MFHKKFIKPIKINILPANLLKKDGGSEAIDFIFLPKIKPKLKKRNWNNATKNGKIIVKPSDILKPIPQTKLSADIAKPRNIASLKSIVFELSKSKYMGY